MDRGPWRAIVHGVAKSWTQLSNWALDFLKKSGPGIPAVNYPISPTITALYLDFCLGHCYQLNCVPHNIYSSSNPDPLWVNVMLFENSVFTNIIKLRWDQTGVGGPESNMMGALRRRGCWQTQDKVTWGLRQRLQWWSLKLSNPEDHHQEREEVLPIRVLGLLNQWKVIRGQTRNFDKALLGHLLQQWEWEQVTGSPSGSLPSSRVVCTGHVWYPASSPQLLLTPRHLLLLLPGGSADKESTCNEVDLGSIPGWGRFPWRRNRLFTPVFLPGEFCEQRSLAALKATESDTTEQVHTGFCSRLCRSDSWAF